MMLLFLSYSDFFICISSQCKLKKADSKYGQGEKNKVEHDVHAEAFSTFMLFYFNKSSNTKILCSTVSCSGVHVIHNLTPHTHITTQLHELTCSRDIKWWVKHLKWISTFHYSSLSFWTYITVSLLSDYGFFVLLWNWKI